MTSTMLKILALIFMFLDHVAEFIPGAPIWLHWIGRISAPIFFFCMAWGFYYTSNRKVYLSRMYGFGVIMAIINYICNNIYQDPYCYISNNIFVTLFLIGVISWILEIRKNDKRKGNRYIIFFCLYQIFSTIICILTKQIIVGYGVFELAGALMGNIIFTEGSILFVFLGVLMYFTKENKKSLATAYTIFCLIFFALSSVNNFSIEGLFYENYQWMMIGTLPFMYLYNGKKGKGYKYLFYLFYPIHIVALFWIGNLCF